MSEKNKRTDKEHQLGVIREYGGSKFLVLGCEDNSNIQPATQSLAMEVRFKM